FIGEMSFIPARAENAGAGRIRCRIGEAITLDVAGDAPAGSGVVAFRPEDMRLEGGDGVNALPARVKAVTFLGSETALDIELAENGTALRLRVPSSEADRVSIGQTVPLAFKSGAGRFFAEGAVQ
ncbi:TOBE domain-containing protein, partial [Rhizobiaceae sp. 2RAB30]